jgi:hypothetical protein
MHHQLSLLTTQENLAPLRRSKHLAAVRTEGVEPTAAAEPDAASYIAECPQFLA